MQSTRLREVAGPDDAGPAAARRVWDGMIEKDPGVTMCPASAGDMVDAVADPTWLMNSSDVYVLLTVDRGWVAAAIRALARGIMEATDTPGTVRASSPCVHGAFVARGSSRP